MTDTVDIDVKKWNPHALLVEMGSNITTLQNSLTILKILNKFTQLSRNFTPRFILQWNKNICPNKVLEVNVDTKIIQNNQCA